MKPTPEERFWRRVQKTEGCWYWTGGCTSAGYGSMFEDGKRYQAHRWVYERYVGLIPEGLVVDHLCGNRKCVRPSHLEPVTRGENTLRGETVSGINKRKTHCIRDHDLAEAWVSKRGKRHCRECHNIHQRVRRAA